MMSVTVNKRVEVEKKKKIRFCWVGNIVSGNLCEGQTL